MKKLFILNFVILITVNINAQKEAPDFKVTDIYGHLHHLYLDYIDQGKYVYIDFFGAGCGPCQGVSPKIDTVFRKFGCNYSDIVFIGIDYSTYDENIWNFKRDFGMTFPAVSGDEGGGRGVFQAYDITSYPYEVIIDPTGKIIKNEILYWLVSAPAAQLIDSLENLGFTQKLCSGNDFIFYSLISETDSVVADINYENQSIDIELPAGTDLTNLISTFINAINSTIEIDGEEQISGKTVLDFSEGSLTYKITPEEGDPAYWDVTVYTVSSTNFINNNFNLYPNPSKGKFYIDFSGINKVHKIIIISDISGKQVYKTETSSEYINIDISNNPVGIYMLNIYIGNTVISKKIIKNK